MWPLTRAWYGDRLDPEYTAKSVAHRQRLLAGAGLTADFWQVS
jgi:hypothetical protein